MREETGDLWTYPADAIVIPTNGVVRRNRAVMGAGVALEAAKRWTRLPRLLGEAITEHGLQVEPFSTGDGKLVLAFPTKRDWRQPSDLALIERSAHELADIVNLDDVWQRIVLPRLGCGRGGLVWADVRAVLAPILAGDRFVVVSREQGQEG